MRFFNWIKSLWSKLPEIVRSGLKNQIPFALFLAVLIWGPEPGQRQTGTSHSPLYFMGFATLAALVYLLFYKQIATLWNKLPEIVRKPLAEFGLFGLLLAFLYFGPGVGTQEAGSRGSDFDGSFDSSSFLLTIALLVIPFTVIMFLISMRAEANSTTPEEIVNQQYEKTGPFNEMNQKAMHWFIGIGSLLCIVGVWYVGHLIAPERPEIGFQFAGGLTLILAFMLALPVIVMVIGVLLGHFLPPVKVKITSTLRLPLPPEQVFEARKQIQRYPEFSPLYDKVEKIKDSALPSYRLTPLSWLGRLMGASAVVTQLEAEKGRSLVLESVLKQGNMELTRFTFEDDGTGGCLIHCEDIADLQSGMLKAIVRFMGVDNIGTGSAAVEAKYFAGLTGIEPKMSNVQSSLLPA